MTIHPEFPSHRRKDSGCSAEAGIDDQPADSGLPGHAPNELKPPPEAPKLEFAVRVGRFAIQVKGGTYSVDEAA